MTNSHVEIDKDSGMALVAAEFVTEHVGRLALEMARQLVLKNQTGESTDFRACLPELLASLQYIAVSVAVGRDGREDGYMKHPRRHPRLPGKSSGSLAGERRSAGTETTRLRMRKLDGNRFALLPPSCAFERKEDIEEVQQMIAAGEFDIARDELLYLVADCRAFLEAHNLLGELALEEDDIPLARGHFGFAYEIVLDSLPAGFRGRLPAKQAYNAEFFLAGRGVARCLIAKGQLDEGREVLELLARFDPRELTVQALLTELNERENKST